MWTGLGWGLVVGDLDELAVWFGCERGRIESVFILVGDGVVCGVLVEGIDVMLRQVNWDFVEVMDCGI